MSTPLVASYRVDLAVTALGIIHHLRHYVKVTSSADPTGYDVLDRLNNPGIGLSTAIDALWTLLAPLYKSGQDVFGDAKLEQLSGIAWIPIASWTTAVVPTGTAPTYLAGQLTMTMRDTAFHKVKDQVMESRASAPNKTASPTGFGVPFTAYFQGFTDPGVAGPNDPYQWVRGRSNLSILGFVSASAWLNRKIGRRRGV